MHNSLVARAADRSFGRETQAFGGPLSFVPCLGKNIRSCNPEGFTILVTTTVNSQRDRQRRLKGQVCQSQICCKGPTGRARTPGGRARTGDKYSWHLAPPVNGFSPCLSCIRSKQSAPVVVADGAAPRTNLTTDNYKTVVLLARSRCFVTASKRFNMAISKCEWAATDLLDDYESWGHKCNASKRECIILKHEAHSDVGPQMPT
ncbi:hypothetical protein EVAR_32088_1 [Eumeta japonica]|uniref:Uncharacterized protein n=1 Tax=Eumeta variegata TaxID=151549 RepID=A0A4C1V509_EUMVA|nr:hypothetical protein EVAR_32088_1 [Eumeta japonica]